MKIKHLLMISGLMAIVFVSRCHATWDVTTPAGTEAKSLGDDRIREFKTDVQTALNTYGIFPGTDTTNPKYYWTIGSGSASNRPVTTSTGTMFVNTSSGCIERYGGVLNGWNCIQTLSSVTPVNISTLSLTNNSTAQYTPGTSNVIVFIKNDDTDTTGMNASIRFRVGGADDTRLVVIRDTSTANLADLAINVRSGAVISEPQRWKGDGTILIRSSTTFVGSSTFTGTALFNSSATFNQQVTFSSTTIFSASPAFLAFNSSNDSNVTGNNVAVSTVDFDTEIFDQGNNFLNDTFTAPATSIYNLCTAVEFDELTASTHNNISIRIITSNRTYDFNQVGTAGTWAFDEGTFGGCVIADMNAGDQAHIGAFVGSGSQDVDIVGNAIGGFENTWFSGFQIK